MENLCILQCWLNGGLHNLYKILCCSVASCNDQKCAADHISHIFESGGSYVDCVRNSVIGGIEGMKSWPFEFLC